MIFAAILVAILSAKGGKSQAVKDGDKPVGLCTNSARLYPDPDNCQKFMRCVNRKLVTMSCPSTTVFDSHTQVCTWRNDIIGCNNRLNEDPTGSKNQQHIPTTYKKLSISIEPQIEAHSSRETHTPRDSSSMTTSSYQTSRRVPLGNHRDRSVHRRTNGLNPQFAMSTESDTSHFNFRKLSLSPGTKNSQTTQQGPVTSSNLESSTGGATLSGDEKYEEMQDVTKTEGKIVENNGQSRHSSAPTIRLYQADIDSLVTNGNSIQSSISPDTDNINNDLYPGSDSRDDENELSTTTPFSTDNSEAITTAAIIETIDSTQETVAETIDSTQETVAETIDSTQEIVAETIDSTQEIVAESSKSDRMQTENDIKDVTFDKIIQTAAEVNEERIIENNGNDEKLKNITKVMVDNKEVVNSDDIDGSELPNNIQDMDNLKNTLLIPTQISSTVNMSSNDTQNSRPQKSYKNGWDSKETHASRNESEDENSSLENDHFDSLSQLIVPFKARFDRKSYKLDDEMLKQSLPAQTFKLKNVNKDSTWTSDLTYIPSAKLELMTGKIVNRDLLTDTKAEKVQPRWYDTEVKSNKYESSTSPTTLTEATELYTSSLRANISPDTTDTRAEYARVTQIEDEELSTLSPRTLTVSSDDGQSSFTREVYEINPSGQSSMIQFSKLPTDEVTRTTAEDSAVHEYNTDEPPTPEGLGTNGRLNTNYMSAPYLAKGLIRPFRCPELDGHFPDSKNCAVYYHCSRGQAYRRDCPTGQVFHAKVQSCVSNSLNAPCLSSYTDNIQDEETLTANFVCKQPDGVYKDQLSCKHYFECTNDTPIRRKCMMGTVFDDVMGKCSWSKFVPGCEQDITSETKIDNYGHGFDRFQCPRDGYFRDLERCDVYYLCAGGESLRMTCDPGTSFDARLNMCAWNHLVDDCESRDDLESEENLERNIVMAKSQKKFSRASVLDESSFKEPVASLNVRQFSCPEAHGLYSDPNNCSHFIHCFKKVAYRHQCQPGTVFSTENAACTWRQLVHDCQKTTDDQTKFQQTPTIITITESKTRQQNIATEPYQKRLSATKTARYQVRPVELHEFSCPTVVDGFYRDDLFCDVFHRCVLGTKFTFTCPAGTFFRLEDKLCDFWETVTDCTPDGLRVEAMGKLPKVRPSSQALLGRQFMTRQLDVKVVSIDADPTPCPAANGLFPHPRNCYQFLFCNQFSPLVLTCPESLLYNAQSLTCDYANKVQCIRYDGYGNK